MKKNDFLAMTSYSFRHTLIDSELSMFVLGTDAVTNTVLMELLSKELRKENGRYCLAVSDYASFCHSFPEVVNKENVALVMTDSYEFVKALSEAGRIFTIWYIPQYFVKKEGQIIYEVISDKRLRKRSDLSSRIRHYARTVNNTDYFIRDDVYEELYINRRSQERKIVLLLPSAHRNPKKEVMQLRNLKSSTEKGNIVYGISSAAWDYCKTTKDTDPDLLEEVYPFTHSLEVILGKSEVIVCANDGAAAIADRSGKDCVFYGKTEESLSDKIFRSYDISNAVEMGYKLLSEHYTDVAHEVAVRGYNIKSVDMYDFLPCSNKVAKIRILIVVGWSDIHIIGYLYRLITRFCEPGSVDIEVLLPSMYGQDIDLQVGDMIESMKVFTYEGVFQNPEDFASAIKVEKHADTKKALMEREWKRIVGDSEYDELWLIDETILPVAEMEKYAPAQLIRPMKVRDISVNAFNLFKSVNIKSERLTLDENSECCFLDGDEFYSLGMPNSRECFISKKIAGKPYVLIKYDETKVESIRIALAELDHGESTAIVVNRSKQNVSGLADGRNVIEIPVLLAPLELIGSCEFLIASEEDIEYTAAKVMSVPVKQI